MAVIRLPTVSTDVVIHYNHPVVLGASSSSTVALGEVGGGVGSEGEALEYFREVVRSFVVVDWGLFGV